MSKQDRQGVRTARDIEQKYNFGKTFQEVFGVANEAKEVAEKSAEAIEETNIRVAEAETSISRNSEQILLRATKQELREVEVNMTTNLRIESSRGTVFKNDSIATVLSVVIYRGADRITDIATLRAAMGSGAYIQWKWKRLDEETFGVISASDPRLGNDGFTFTLSPDDVNTKVTFMCELIA